MPTRSCLFLPLAAGLALAGCAIAPARIWLPAPLLEEPVFAFEGMGSGQQGRFRAGEYAASFTRSDTRLSLFDGLDERRGGRTGFSLEGPGIAGTLEGDCAVAQRTITIAFVSFEPEPMAYVCRFRNRGRPLAARFEVQEARTGLADRLMRRSRRGEIAFGRARLTIASVHQIEGSPIETATPIGYLFEEDGVPAGAITLNGRPSVRFARGSDADTRAAVMIAATALGVLWDPADSALGEE